ncbi:MAG: right-handed parallel beta-helix repeat-containing protein [Planctomycetes bacterium]|nr:right-handed parallel beta-helix repeat-containing protein [Planctomycetota bacterium]MBL7037071.1 right-handed parallel beta-helix repeat-containing protein [Pirellulaceae bacterium]
MRCRFSVGCLLLVSAAYGAEYYVDVESRGGPSSDANPGTLEKPWRTLSRATGETDPRPQAGDTIWVRKGVYPETVIFRTGGTADRPLTIKAFPGEQPVIDGEGRRGSGIVLARDGSADHVVIEELTLKNFRAGGTGISIDERTDVILKGVDISGARIGVSFNACSRCRLEESEVHHCREGNVLVSSRCSDIVLADNHIHHSFEGHSLSIYAPGDAVRGEGAVVSVEPQGSGLARFTTKTLELHKVREGTLTGQDAAGSVTNPGLILLFPDPNPAPDGRPLPGGTVRLEDGRRWFVLRNNPEWDDKPYSADGKTGLFEVGQADLDALTRAKHVYVAYTFSPDVANRDIQILRNEVDHGAVQGIWVQRAEGVLIQGNRTHHNGATGIQIESLCRRVWLDGNVSFANCMAYSHETGIWLDETIDAVVQNNTLYENQKGLGVTQCQWVLARRNVICNNRAQHVTENTDGCRSNAGGFWFSGGRHTHMGAPPGAEHNAFVHNTLYGNGTPTSAWGGIQHGLSGYPRIGCNRVLNNLVQNTLGAHPVYVGCAPAVLDGNIYHSTGPFQVLWHEKGRKASYNISDAQGLAEYRQATGQDVRSLVAPVDGVRLQQGDFRLTPGSVAMDRAQPLTWTTVAGTGTKVPVEDVSCFSAGLKTRSEKVLVPGDEIMIADVRARILALDRRASQLIVDRNLQWREATPVTYTYRGEGPDVGALEGE